MQKQYIVGGLLLAMLWSVHLNAYDVALAQKFNKTFSHYSLKNLNNSKMVVDAETVMKMLKKEEDFLFLDIRTSDEVAVVGIRTDNRVEIPFDILFQKESLDRLPKDRAIIIVCHSGNRALQAATSLEMLGFKNAKVLYGGIIALAKSASTKNVSR